MTFTHNFVTPPKLVKVIGEDGISRYTTPSGKRYESVTSYIGRMLPKPELHEWRKRVGEKKATAIAGAAAKRGTSLHKAAEKYLLNEALELDDVPATKSLFMKIKPIMDRLDNIRLIETSIYSDELELGGTPDTICDYSGELAICDFKSSTRLKKKIDIMNYWLQTAAYAIMFNEHYGQMPKKAVIIFGIPDLPYGTCQIVPMDDCLTWFHEFRRDPIGFHSRLQVEKDRLKKVRSKAV